jgi:COMPASS component SWD3
MPEVFEYMIEGQAGVKTFSIKFSWDNKYIAAGLETGQIHVYSVRNKELKYVIKPEKEKVPISYVRWRPENGNFKTRAIFVTSNADGEIQYWHLRSGKCLASFKDESKESLDKQLFCIDYNEPGTKLVSCGSEPLIRVYDEFKRTLDVTLGGEEFSMNGHSMRVYCCKFDKKDPNVIFSGGWDQNLVIWDLREGKPVNSIFGPLICGDGIDVSSITGEVITASHKQSDQLQRWDIRKGQLVESIDWDQHKISSEPCYLYAGQFSKKECDIVAAGGSNTNEVKLFDITRAKTISCIHGLPREVYSIDFSFDDKLLAISGGDGFLRVF